MNSFKPKQQPVLAAANIRPFSFLASFFLSFFLTLFKYTNFQGFTYQINRHVTGTRLLYQNHWALCMDDRKTIEGPLKSKGHNARPDNWGSTRGMLYGKRNTETTTKRNSKQDQSVSQNLYKDNSVLNKSYNPTRRN